MDSGLPSDVWGIIQSFSSSRTLHKLCCVSQVMKAHVWSQTRQLNFVEPVLEAILLGYITRSPRLEALQVCLLLSNWKYPTLDKIQKLVPHLTTLGIRTISSDYTFMWQDVWSSFRSLASKFPKLQNLELPPFFDFQVLGDLPLLTKLTIPYLGIKESNTLPLLAKYTNLTALHLPNTNYSDCRSIPCCLSQLRSLTFSGQATGYYSQPLDGLEHLSTFQNLTYLDVSSRGRMLCLFGHLPNLETLILPDRIDFTTTPPSFPPTLRVLDGKSVPVWLLQHLTRLERLTCPRHSPTESKFWTIMKLTNLVSLQIPELTDDNALGLTGENVLGHLTQLKALQIPSCQLTNRGLEFLTALTNLSELILEQGKFDDFGIQRFQDLTNLVRISLKACPNVIGRAFQNLRNLILLEDLNLKETKFAPKFFVCLTKLPRLRYLDLSGTQINDQALVSLKDMKSLESISLFDCSKVSRRGPVGVQDFCAVKWEVQNWSPKNPDAN